MPKQGVLLGLVFFQDPKLGKNAVGIKSKHKVFIKRPIWQLSWTTGEELLQSSGAHRANTTVRSSTCCTSAGQHGDCENHNNTPTLAGRRAVLK